MSKLDETKSYTVTDNRELRWFFKFGRSKVSGDVGWHSFYQMLGSSIIIPMGTMPEEEVYNRLLTHGSNPIGEDDIIDLHVWMNRGGLSKLMKEYVAPTSPLVMRSPEEEV